METLKYIVDKFQIDLKQKSPIRIPFDRYRGLTSLFRELGYKVGAEIGVDRGRYSKWICMKNKGVKLFCVDPYIYYDRYVERRTKESQSGLNDSYEKAVERLAPFNCEIIKKTSMEAVKDFNDNSLDFVYIDGNHTFEYAVNDIAEWSKKVRPGGIVSGHDFVRSVELKKPWVPCDTEEQRIKLCQVKDAVEAWTYANRIKPFFLTIHSTWFYVKV